MAVFRDFHRVLKHVFFALFLVVCSTFGASVSAIAVTVTYVCGIASGAGTTVNNVNGDGSYVVSSSVDANDYCTSPGADYEFVGWACGNTNSSFVTASVEGQNISVPSEYMHTSSSQHYVQEGVSVVFENFMSNYANTFYTVWDDTTCVAVWRDTNICSPGTTVDYILNAPADSSNVIDLNIHSQGTTSPLDYYDGNNNLVYSVWFESLVSNIPGVPLLPGDPGTGSSNGTHCWCRVTGYSMAGGVQQSLNNAQWIYLHEDPSLSTDASNCSAACGAAINEEFDFRVAAYATQICEYNVTYHSGNCSINGTNNAVTDTEHPTAGSSYSVLGSGGVSGVFSSIGACLDFVGWSNSPVNGFVQNSSVANYICQSTASCGTIYPYPASNTDLYAVCASKRYSVVYHPGTCGGFDYTDTSNAWYGIGYTVLSNATAHITGDFQGWDTNSTGTTAQYNAGSSYVAGCLPAGSTVHFYGVCAQSYKLTYEEGINGDVQNFPEEAAQITTGQSYHLAGEPSLDDYIFIGWLCDHNLESGAAVETGYFADDSFTFDGSDDVECVGQWQPRTSCTPGDVITYLLGSSEWAESAEEMISGEGEPGDDPDKPSVKFGEDTINYAYMCSDTPGIPFSSTSNSTPAGDGRYCWCRVTGYTIDGKENEEELPVSVTPWAFVGYDDDCESQCFTLCGNALANEERMRGSMYMSYGCAYAISYSAAQGCSAAFSSMPAPTSVVYGDSYTLASAPTAATGWAFNGWSCPNLSNSTLSAGAPGIYNYSGNAACSAQCTCAQNYTMVNGECVEDQPDTYTLTYLPGASSGVTDVPGAVSVSAGSSYTLVGNPIRLGYDFNGWRCLYGTTSLCTDSNSNTINCSTGNTITMPPANVNCTAQWTDNSDYHINYTLGQFPNAYPSGSVPPNPTHCQYNVSCNLASDPTSATGWVFNGWSCQQPLTGTTLPNGNFSGGTPVTYAGNGSGTDNVICEASWKCADNYVLENGQCIPEYTLSYEVIAPASGVTVSGAPSSVNFTAAGQYPLSESVPTVNFGWVFDGWTCTDSGDNDLCDGLCQAGATVYLPLDNVTCVARWRAITYTIEYDLDNGTHGNSHPDSATYNEAFTVSNPTRTGYTFDGWYISGMDFVEHTIGSTTTNMNYISNVTATNFKNLRSSSGTVTFTAHWEPITYTITYNLDNGTHGNSHPDSATYNVAFTVSNPTRTGYTFEGWTISGMDDTEHTIGSTTTSSTSESDVFDTNFKNLLSSSGTVTFTAHWTQNAPDTYTVTYYCGTNSAGQGNPPVDNTAYAYGAEVTTPTVAASTAENMCHNDYYPVLNSWRCNGVDREPGTTFNIIEDTDCVPVWIKETRQIDLLAPEVSGWNDHKIFAWLYKGAHLSLTNAATYMTTNSNPLSSSDIPSRTGYVFKGYYSQSQGTSNAPVGTKWIEQSGYITEAGMEESKWIDYLPGHPHSWYAGWEPINYTITYNLSGGTHGGINHPLTATYDVSFLVDNPTRTGYTFAGWTITGMDDTTHTIGSTTTSSTSESDVFDTNFKNLLSTSGTVTFTAVWTQNSPSTYHVTYNVFAPIAANFGDSIPTTHTEETQNNGTTKKYTYVFGGNTAAGNPYILVGVPSATGYNCPVWTCQNVTTSESITPEFHVGTSSNDITGYRIVMPSSDVLCTTNCVPNVVLLEWNPNGGTPDPITTPASCTYGTPNGISVIQSPTQIGHTFNGWLLTKWGCDLSGLDSNFPGVIAVSPNLNETWGMEFEYGIFRGLALCSSQTGNNSNGTYGNASSYWSATGNDLTEAGLGGQCWCKLDTFKKTGWNPCKIVTNAYIYFGNVDGGCSASSCADACAGALRGSSDFRRAIFTVSQ